MILQCRRLQTTKGMKNPMCQHANWSVCVSEKERHWLDIEYRYCLVHVFCLYSIIHFRLTAGSNNNNNNSSEKKYAIAHLCVHCARSTKWREWKTKPSNIFVLTSLWAWMNQAWIGLNSFQLEIACSKLILPYSYSLFSCVKSQNLWSIGSIKKRFYLYVVVCFFIRQWINNNHGLSRVKKKNRRTTESWKLQFSVFGWR